jgi:hypothetical protein
LHDRGSVDRISLDQNCNFSLDGKFHFHLIKFFETFHLIESFNNAFDQTPKKLSLDQKFLLMIRSSEKNPSVLFWHLIESSNNGILGF